MLPFLLSKPSEHCAHASIAEFLIIFSGEFSIKTGSTIATSAKILSS